jgi:hypothetical protein
VVWQAARLQVCPVDVSLVHVVACLQPLHTKSTYGKHVAGCLDKPPTILLSQYRETMFIWCIHQQFVPFCQTT